MNRPSLHKSIIIIGILIVVSLFHYYTSFRFEQIHDVYTRLYYIPIILAAFWFGTRGGLIASIAAAALFLPHLIFQWNVHALHGHFSQYIEMGMFVVIGVVTGALADLEKKQRHRAEKAYDQLEKSFEKAREAARLAAIGQLSAGIAHEVRNPLAGIKGAVEIVTSDIDEANPKHRFVGIINKEIARLESLVTEFLRFARPPKPELAPDNINRIVSSVLELSRKHLSEGQVKTEINLEEDTPSALMDTNQVKQVALNLLLNAVQAMPVGGTIKIHTYARNNTVHLELSDTGKGIPEGGEEDIFAPFFTTRPGGTGLGLAVSRRIIRGHGGEITVHNAADGGATFIVKLPVLQEDPTHDSENSIRG
jgi:two-component system, NtrC family, sensor histidine kinase HydH